MRKLYGLFLFVSLHAETVPLPGLKAPVEILRDRWGIPHVYAANQNDLFFANGYINARDRLFQIDLWRRRNSGKLAEALGPAMIPRDRIALLFRPRVDWKAEWQSYGADTRPILTAFTNGINAYIRSLNGKRPPEFAAAGYDPGLWIPEDCLGRIGGMSIMRNAARELVRAQDIASHGLAEVARFQPPEPPVPLLLPRNLDIQKVYYDAIRDYAIALAADPFGGSNNWAVDGTRTASGKPLLASDPHRVLEVPSLRRTIHLTMPGWSAIGAHEPALPGIALGHNGQIAFGFTITGIDQEDVYIERLNPRNHDEYFHNGAFRRMTIENVRISVKDSQPRDLALRYTVHGPVIFTDEPNHLAYALRTVAAEPGGAGYLTAITIARATNWQEFRNALARFKTPSENMVYADRMGNIGFQVAGLTPIRNGWTGLLPVPGDGGYEWTGFLNPANLPNSYNPPAHQVATANNNILPPGYKYALSYDWGEPFRVQRIAELLAPPKKFTVADFERMQYDVTSILARRFQAVLRGWKNPPVGQAGAALKRILAWDARLTADSVPTLIYKVWWSKIPQAIYKTDLARRMEAEILIGNLESAPDWQALAESLRSATTELSSALGSDMTRWTWSRANWHDFKHKTKRPEWSRGRIARPGDTTTLNAAGTGSGASYRQVIDLSNWDNSTSTNTPGESGDPNSPHYSDLLDDWAKGKYHPLLYTRKAVEAATTERIKLVP